MSRTTLHSRLLLSFWGVLVLTGALSIFPGIYITRHPGGRYTLVFYVLTLLLFLLIAGLFLVFVNSIWKPIKELSAAMDEIATSPNLREIKIDHAPQEIENLLGAFNRMQDAIRERRRMNQEKLIRSDRLAMIGQLAAGVAHEINNPLGSILLFTRLVMQQSARMEKRARTWNASKRKPSAAIPLSRVCSILPGSANRIWSPSM